MTAQNLAEKASAQKPKPNSGQLDWQSETLVSGFRSRSDFMNDLEEHANTYLSQKSRFQVCDIRWEQTGSEAMPLI